ncbi:MAG: efflux RND transporter permease subunit, partial [Cyanobacteria bacterium P01_D01_bin.44]
MNTNISAWSIRRSVPTLVLFLVLTLAGLVSFRQLGIDANPNIDIPIIQVEVRQPGAGSEEMERQVTQKIEDAIAGLGNIDEIYSSVSDGYSYTAIQFDFGVDTDKVANDVRDAVSQIRQTLPQDIQEPTVQTLQYEGGEILTYAVQSDQRSIEDLSDLVDRTISPALLSVKGVAQVTRLGGFDREIRVDLNPDQLDAFGITATEVNAQIQNSNLNLPAGQLKLSEQAQGIRTLGSADSVEALRNLGILLPGGETIPLNALGAVKDDFAEVRQSAYVNNQPVVSFAVYRGKGSLLVSVEAGVKDAIASLQDTLPKDVQLQLIFTRATDVRDAYQATINGLLLGSLLAVIVVGCFLRNWRTIVITAIAIPLSIIPTFIVLQGFGYSLNNMTLLALTLAVGNLVDDAIVEIENVERHIGMGKAPVRAALDSTAEVGLAVITTTATIVAVFIPVAFMGGIPGQFFKPFGVTVAVSTLFSTLVARLVTPMMAARLLQPQPLEQHQPPRPQRCTANGTPIPRVLAPYYGLLNAA